jgi:hypothetical protein
MRIVTAEWVPRDQVIDLPVMSERIKTYNRPQFLLDVSPVRFLRADADQDGPISAVLPDEKRLQGQHKPAPGQ